MAIPTRKKLEFLYRTTLAQGNAKGVVAHAQVTVCRGANGALYYIPDDPDQLPLVKRLLKRELGA